tara:strand:+ start:837 stop:1091 length:255 start_codon:yes stop_codon:yes gene_type:complete
MKYLIDCCKRVVDSDNKPKWCIKCGTPPNEMKVTEVDEPSESCDRCEKNERKWEFRYERQWKKQKELEATISKLRKQIRELKNG